MGYNVSPQFVQTVVVKFDHYGRRSLTLDNFIQACVMLKSLTDAFRQRDAAMTGYVRMSYEDFMIMGVLYKPWIHSKCVMSVWMFGASVVVFFFFKWEYTLIFWQLKSRAVMSIHETFQLWHVRKKWYIYYYFTQNSFRFWLDCSCSGLHSPGWNYSPHLCKILCECLNPIVASQMCYVICM